MSPDKVKDYEQDQDEDGHKRKDQANTWRETTAITTTRVTRLPHAPGSGIQVWGIGIFVSGYIQGSRLDVGRALQAHLLLPFQIGESLPPA